MAYRSKRQPISPDQMELEEWLATLEDEDVLDAALLADGDEDEDGAPVDDELSGGYRAKLAFAPRPYQEEALAAWADADGRGVVVLPTGAGKTVLAMMAIERVKLRTLIVVPTIELLYQWRDTVVKTLGVPAAKVGVIGDGLRQLRPITVITYASAAMPEAPITDFGLLVCDEVHHLPSQSYSEIARRANTPYRLGLTATPERSDGLHRALDRLIGPEVYRRAPADLAADGHIAQFKEQRVFVDLTPDEL
ncbi:MAG TPA: DEAD/DEAH box helicase, partial [Herpetosiphonaceae bacterium]|nr:DEAD/DEAH box helicase [Herpetosiphonaceae bacterium]